jgi:alpha-beta hydrolase superfamily lysophospholipase
VRQSAARAELAHDTAMPRGKVPARTITTIPVGGVELQPQMPAVVVPLLILHGGADRVTPATGSRVLAERAASRDRKLVI